MNDNQAAARLRRAILQNLGITQPPFQLRIEFGIGSASVSLRDAHKGVDSFGDGAIVWNVILSEFHDLRIQELAAQAADEIRPHLVL